MTVQVLTAIVLGAAVGALWPAFGIQLKLLGDGFIRLVKLVVGPVVFLTVVSGIVGAGRLSTISRIGLKALIYFEIVTTLSLMLGLAAVNILRPGVGLEIAKVTKPAATTTAATQSVADFLLNILPENAVSAFAKGDLLQILVFAVLFGTALAALGNQGKPISDFLDQLAQVFFKIIAFVMRIAPLGAFGAMAYTVGQFGISALINLGQVMMTVYVSMLLFITLVLGPIAHSCGVSLWRLLCYIKEELVVVLGTSSSESVLPRMIEKMQAVGCSRTVVGLVIPTGYSFNLDGTSIYLSIAAVFIAQAYGIPLSLWEQLSILGILLVTSKGAAAVVGSAFVTLTATVQATGVLPPEGLALLLGVDRFMSEARSITNLIGNAVATIALAKSEGEFDTTLGEIIAKPKAPTPAPQRDYGASKGESNP